MTFDDCFETVEDSHNGVAPARWEWLCEHKREMHVDDKIIHIDNKKI